MRDTGSWVTEGSCYYKRAILKNITFKGLTFWAKTDINTSESTTVYDGFTFTDCTFDLGTTADGNQAIRYYNENNNGNVKNLVVEGCTFKTCSQGVYTAHVKNVTVTGSTFDTTGHNAIAIQDHKGPCDHGKVVITGNTFKNIGDRIIRFNNVGMGTTVTITGNTADGNSGKLDKATGKREIVKATTLPVNAADSIKASGNDWGANTVVEGVFIDDYATKLGTEACPYSREQFAAMTRADYIAAQGRLGGTLYVNVGNYAYEKNGVLGNGVRDDTTGQVPDHSKLNAYGENGYLGEKNDGANGHAVVFVGGTITSGVTGYTSIDSIGTSLLLAVPAYTKVTFKGTAFKNVLSFDYQLYTSPWSQLGGLTFNGCTFDGIIVGAPVYYAGPSGQSTAFLDRLFYSAGGKLTGKPAAAVVSCRRGGASAAFDRLNKYFGINSMPIVTSQYWNQVHGNSPDEVRRDEEGLQTMRTLGHNMAWLLHCIEAGRAAGIKYPEREAPLRTNFIR